MRTQEDIIFDAVYGVLGIGFLIFAVLTLVSGIAFFGYANSAVESVFIASLLLTFAGVLGLIWSSQFQTVVSRALGKTVLAWW